VGIAVREHEKPGGRPPLATLRGSELQQRSAAHQFGLSLKFATAKLERATNDRTQGRERQAERGGDFNDPPRF
jgi:hypothetical protein